MSAGAALPPPAGVPEGVWLKLARRNGSRWEIDERDATGAVIGTAHRDAAGRKGFAPGGQRGLIVAWPLPTYAGAGAAAPVFVCEGASDIAALLGLNLDAVGVPMAGQCGPVLAELLAGRHAVIVADADDAGRRGAQAIAAALIPRCASVRTIEPPGGAKDARAAVIAGADREAFLTLAGAAPCAMLEASRAEGAPVIVRLSDVAPELVVWLWPGRIALGKLTLIAGDPGLGKSFLTLDLAARVSRGLAWPDAPGVPTTPGGVVLLNAEDGVADTIRPRLDAAGADVSRIYVLQAVNSVERHGRESVRAFDLSRDLAGLEQAIQSAGGCRLVVIDPVTAYLGGVDSHKNAEVRGLLAPLGDLAARHRVAIVAVTHLNKSGGSAAIYRATGSLAFSAAPRAAWLVSKDRADPRRRLFLTMKNNIAPEAGGLAYRIEAKDACAAVAWELGAVNLSADDALASDGTDGGERTECEEAAAWLRDLLAKGPRPASDVVREAREAGISIATLRRAKTASGVRSLRAAFGGGWDWALPAHDEGEQPPKALTQDAHTPNGEHLGAHAAENNGSCPKALTPERVSALGEHLGVGSDRDAPPEQRREVSASGDP